MKAYFFLLHLLQPFSKLAFHLSYSGLENVPSQGPVIVCCNHRSVIDPFFVATVIKRAGRQVRFMAKSELFEDHGRLARSFLEMAGAFPVQREKGDMEAVKMAAGILSKGGVLGIFPQGRVVFDNAPFRPKAGFALIAARTKASVLPVSIYCDGKLTRFRKKVTIRVGKLIAWDELGLAENNRECLKQAALLLAKRINSQLEEKH